MHFFFNFLGNSDSYLLYIGVRKEVFTTYSSKKFKKMVVLENPGESLKIWAHQMIIIISLSK